jgi:DNA polymerase-3 subunit delta'
VTITIEPDGEAGPPTGSSVDPWAVVVGQDRAVAQLQAAARAPVHAYLLVGPRGSGKRALAGAFAGALLSAGSVGDEIERHQRLAAAEQHPDQLVFERVGAAITRDQIDAVIERASRSPIEGRRKVLVLDEFHLIQGDNPGKLLKVIEEPPPGTIFVVLAEFVPPELVTIASRCVRIDLGPVPEVVMVERLVAEGVDRDVAVEAASAAVGDLGRARLLVSDPRLALRRAAWAAVPGQLDGTGTTATRLVDELFVMIDDAAAPLRERQALEVAGLEERVAQLGERGSGRKGLDDLHKREIRRLRIDELRFGLLVLSRHYRDELVVSSRPGPLVAALAAAQATSEGLVRNPNELLQFQALFLRLGALR